MVKIINFLAILVISFTVYFFTHTLPLLIFYTKKLFKEDTLSFWRQFLVYQILVFVFTILVIRTIK
jgi:hypothetical protein